MIKNNFLLHGNAKVSGFMGADTLCSTGQAGKPQRDFCRYTRKTSLRLRIVLLLFSDTEIERGYLCRQCLRNLRQIQEEVSRIKCSVIRGNKIDLRFRQEAKGSGILFLWIARHQAKQDRSISLHFFRWLCRIANPVNTQTNALTFQVLIHWSKKAKVFPCISATELNVPSSDQMYEMCAAKT